MNAIALDELNPIVLEKLRSRAKRHDRSLEEEVKAIVEEAVRGETPDPVALVSRIRRQTAGRQHTDSGVLQREGRNGIIEEPVAEKPKDPLAGVMRIRQKLSAAIPGGKKPCHRQGWRRYEGKLRCSRFEFLA